MKFLSKIFISGVKRKVLSMIRSQAIKTRSVFFTLEDIVDNLNEHQRDYLRHVLQCKHDLSDVCMMVTSNERLCLWCDRDLTNEEEIF